MQITPNEEIAKVGLSRFLEQYKGTIAFKRLIEIYLESVQELEDVAFQVILKRMLENATDIQLDTLGAIVGEQRQGKDDDNYRIWIAVRIRLNRSFGTPVDIIDVVQLATDAAFEFREYNSGAFSVLFSETPEFPNDISVICYLAKAAGINITVVYPPEGATPFKFMNLGDTSDPDFGFSDVP